MLERDENSTSRRSFSKMFFKMGLCKYFPNFTGKHLCWSLFLIKLQAFRPLYFNTCVILRNLRISGEHLFYRTSPVAAFTPFPLLNLTSSPKNLIQKVMSRSEQGNLQSALNMRRGMQTSDFLSLIAEGASRNTRISYFY